MSRAACIAAFVAANPGSSHADICQGIGIESLGERNSVSATIATMLKGGRLRHDGRPARSGRRYFPTDTTLVDRRRKADGTLSRRQQQAATAIARVARRAAAKPPKPTPAADMTIVRKPEPPMKAPATVAPQTVDEFIAAGGRIQVLPPHACGPSSILRFDHSRTPHATSRPCAASRVRPAAAR